MADTAKELRGLVLSASELRQMTDWPEALIEDYLNLLDNFITLSGIIDIEIEQKLEEVPTDFADKTIPFVDDGFLIQDNLRFTWDALARIFTADGVHVSSGRRRSTKTVNTTPYNITIFDEELFVDTTVEPIVVNLLSGIDGTSYRIHNIGEVGNTVTISPNESDLLFGVNTPEVLYDTEVAIITFNDTAGWD